jgi:hypothetical protein
VTFVRKAHEAGKPEVARAEIIAAAKEAGWSEKTINNRLTALVQTGRLKRPRRGIYQLPTQPDSPQVPDFPTPNPTELRENEIPFFPEFPQEKKGIKGKREEQPPSEFPQFPQVGEGEKGNSGSLGELGNLPTDEPAPESPEPTYATLQDGELVDIAALASDAPHLAPTGHPPKSHNRLPS